MLKAMRKHVPSAESSEEYLKLQASVDLVGCCELLCSKILDMSAIEASKLLKEVCSQIDDLPHDFQMKLVLHKVKNMNLVTAESINEWTTIIELDQKVAEPGSQAGPKRDSRPS